MEIGLVESTGMGIVPISWREINEWQRATGVTLPAWEARLIRRLSNEYVTWSRKAESLTCAAPWKHEVTQREREVEDEGLRLALG